MFDKQEKNPASYYFQLLRNWSIVEKWCSRIRQLPDYVIESAVKRIPEDFNPPTEHERLRLIEFLKKRRVYLIDHIRENQNLFPELTLGSQT